MRKFAIVVYAVVAVVAAVIILSMLLGQSADTNYSVPVGTVTLSVNSDILLDNMHLLGRDMHEFVPEYGIMFPETVVPLYEGDSVFDVLQREMRKEGIHMAFQMIPVYNMAFIESIGNISTLDTKPMSGWQYRVNGQNTEMGASHYILAPDDIVEWRFMLDFNDEW